jgi:ribosomal subunit interface protein
MASMADVEPIVHGQVTETVRAYARDKIGRVARSSPRPILYARVDLVEETNPSIERAARAKATLDVSGQLVQAHVAAVSLEEAIDRLEARLRRRLERLAERREGERRQTGIPEPGEWRHGDLPTDRPPYFPRLPDEREVVRRKAFPLPPLTVEEAAFETEMLGHDFFLYRDAASGDDAVLSLAPEGGAAPTVQLAREAPAHDLELARSRLDVTDEPFVFFRDTATGRGAVLYRRYDGHYGLITPSGE